MSFMKLGMAEVDLAKNKVWFKHFSTCLMISFSRLKAGKIKFEETQALLPIMI